ncbi:MAG: dihydropteroate synthase [Chloroflexi bacterium]|nr:dihydropteroate synthase [Chloroflexota bacterium]
MITTLVGSQKKVAISPDGPTVIVGERINPTGRKRLGEAIRNAQLEALASEAIAQAAEGALVIDVNVGVGGIDEVSVLPEAVKVVAAATGLPLAIDSSDPKAIEAALKVYQGKALVNSVTGEEKSLSSVLPRVKEYGAAVIGLCHDEHGISYNAGERLEVAKRILDRAVALGIPAEDVILDPLVLTVSAEPQAGLVTLRTAILIREKLGLNMTMGASNVSFGLPERHAVNNAFIAMAIAHGINSLIANPAAKGLVETVLAADALTGRDEYAMRFLKFYRARQASEGQGARSKGQG